MNNSPSLYSVTEEVLHTITHGIGMLLSIAGLAVLVAYASENGDGWHVVASSIYGATLILLYSASTFYHGISHPRAKRLLQQFDHAAIYLLIAGTYTPFLLVNLREDWGWWLFSIIWVVAITGAVFEFCSYKPFKRLSLGLYLSMGWMIVVAINPMLQNVSTGGLLLLLAGGLSYTCGAYFYVKEQIPYHHVIWHLFVLAGSILHYFSILFYVIP
jgi:hemolysin III